VVSRSDVTRSVSQRASQAVSGWTSSVVDIAIRQSAPSLPGAAGIIDDDIESTQRRTHARTQTLLPADATRATTLAMDG